MGGRWLRAWSWIILLAMSHPTAVSNLFLRGGAAGKEGNVANAAGSGGSPAVGIRTVMNGGKWHVVPDNSLDEAREIFVDPSKGSDEVIGVSFAVSPRT